MTTSARKTRLRFQYGPSKKNGQFYWHIKCRANGKVVANGEGYTTKQNAQSVYVILGYNENDGVCSFEEVDKNGNPVPQKSYTATLVSGGP